MEIKLATAENNHIVKMDIFKKQQSFTSLVICHGFVLPRRVFLICREAATKEHYIRLKMAGGALHKVQPTA